MGSGRYLRVFVVSFNAKAGGWNFETRWKYVITFVLTDAKDGNVFCMLDLTGLWPEVNTLIYKTRSFVILMSI